MLRNAVLCRWIHQNQFIVDWPYQAHLLLGLTIFLMFPFTRLVHMLSAPIWYLGRRGWQLVRTRAPEMPHRSVSVPRHTPVE